MDKYELLQNFEQGKFVKCNFSNVDEKKEFEYIVKWIISHINFQNPLLIFTNNRKEEAIYCNMLDFSTYPILSNYFQKNIAINVDYTKNLKKIDPIEICGYSVDIFENNFKDCALNFTNLLYDRYIYGQLRQYDKNITHQIQKFLEYSKNINYSSLDYEFNLLIPDVQQANIMWDDSFGCYGIFEII